MNQNTNPLFPARITRGAFLLRGLLLLFGGFAAGGMLSYAEHASTLTQIVLVGGGVTLLVFLCVALFCSILIPRLRDIGLHPAWSLLIFVHAFDAPFLLALLLIPADAFAKRSYLR